MNITIVIFREIIKCKYVCIKSNVTNINNSKHDYPFTIQIAIFRYIQVKIEVFPSLCLEKRIDPVTIEC